MKYKPIIIISVFRSGANLLKDILCHLPDFGTWPAENMNALWRHGNTLRKDDEFSSNEATNYVIKYIRKAFNDLSVKHEYKYVVEKTENNVLRIEFVNEIFPEAKFIFVVRDGRDAIASMLKRRHQPIDLVFLFKKFRFVPLIDIPIVVIRYFINMLNRFIFKKRVVYQLGPVFKGMEKLLTNHTEEEVVSIQWAKCIENAYKDLKNIDSNRVYMVKYEELVKNPRIKIDELIEFLKIDLSREHYDLFFNNILSGDLGKDTCSTKMKTVKGLSDKSVGKWKTRLDNDTLNTIMPIIQNAMRALGY